jgi:CubicO group peptidase (beta-lactamase class C family)
LAYAPTMRSTVASRPLLLAALASLAVLALNCASGGGQKPGLPPGGEAKLLSGPCDVVTPAGAQLKVPAGFRAQQRGNVIELLEPDGAARAALVEIEGQDPVAAVKAAWAAVDPAAAWKVEQALKPPPKGGYDQLYVEVYVAKPDRTRASAVARRKGRWIWVQLVQGKPAGLDKRAAQLRTFFSGMKAPGIEKVDLSAKKPRSITASKGKLVAFIEGALRATGTPGLSIAVVEQGKIVLAEGFGLLEQGKPAKVSADTLMMIGSVSKSLTTLMMATLVDAKKLSWTAKVTSVDPKFRLADAKLTRALTVEQLVCACAGLPRKDLPLILEYQGKDDNHVYAELAKMKPSTGLKETFQYQNHMVAAGGYVAAHALDPTGASRSKTFARAMKERVFIPMGMTNTTLDHDAAIKASDRAVPHSQDLWAKHHPLSLEQERFASYIGPSGGIWSSAREMARYVITELNRGVAPDGKRVVSAANLTHRWEPQVKASAKVSYGLGWAVAKTKGLRKITHGGGTMGFATKVSFFPDKGLGVVMISNGTGGHLVESVVQARLLELWFGVDDKAQARLDFILKEQDKEIAKLKKRTGAPDKTWIAPLLGAHENDEIGAISLTAAPGGQYLLDAGEYKTKLLRYSKPDGKTVLLFSDPPLAGLEIAPLEGAAGRLEMRRAQERYIFTRKK